MARRLAEKFWCFTQPEFVFEILLSAPNCCDLLDESFLVATFGRLSLASTTETICVELIYGANVHRQKFLSIFANQNSSTVKICFLENERTEETKLNFEASYMQPLKNLLCSIACEREDLCNDETNDIRIKPLFECALLFDLFLPAVKNWNTNIAFDSKPASHPGIFVCYTIARLRSIVSKTILGDLDTVPNFFLQLKSKLAADQAAHGFQTWFTENQQKLLTNLAHSIGLFYHLKTCSQQNIEFLSALFNHVVKVAHQTSSLISCIRAKVLIHPTKDDIKLKGMFVSSVFYNLLLFFETFLAQFDLLPPFCM